VKIAAPQIISELRSKLSFAIGRHLYGVLGTYAQLMQFEQDHLAQARRPGGDRFPQPINLNRELLARIADNDLRQLVHDESRRPQSVQRRLGLELDHLLAECLQNDPFVIVEHLELALAYPLDFGIFRTRATDQHHILLLLPGERRGDRVTLFHEAAPRFHRSIPTNLIADNHLWELKDG